MLDIIAWLVSVDRALFLFINSTLANPVTDFIMPILTGDLHLKVVYGAIMLLLLVRGPNRLRWAVLFSVIAVTLTDQAASSLIKPALERLRPCRIMEVHLLVGCGAGFSMPSSHAANLFGQAFFFRGIYRPSANYLTPFAIVVALSRVFVGVHYPADIVVGAALGTVIGYLVSKGFHHIIDKAILKRKEEVRNMSIKIDAVQGDITGADTEVIVNAANNHLWMGSGVAGAIKRKGGEEIEREAISRGPIEVGQAVATTAGMLPYKYIIHAAGMGQDLQTSPEIVYKVTQNSLKVADALSVKSIAFPAIGTGVGGMSIESCAGAMIKAVNTISPELKNIVTVQFVLFDENGFKAFENELKKGS